MICSTRMQGELVRTGCGNPEEHFDVIVVGAGTAGAIAGIAAAEQGASVLVLEKGTYCVGIETAAGIRYYYGFSMDVTRSGPPVKAPKTQRYLPETDASMRIEENRTGTTPGTRSRAAVESAVTGVLMSARIRFRYRGQNASENTCLRRMCITPPETGNSVFMRVRIPFGRSSDGLVTYTLNYSASESARNELGDPKCNQNDPEELRRRFSKHASFLRTVPRRG